MSALEWLQKWFLVSSDDEFIAVNAGDYEAYLPTDPDRVTSMTVTLSDFLAWFGATIEEALSAGQNPVDALIVLPPERNRGYGPVFRLWKAKGIGL